MDKKEKPRPKSQPFSVCCGKPAHENTAELETEVGNTAALHYQYRTTELETIDDNTAQLNQYSDEEEIAVRDVCSPRDVNVVDVEEGGAMPSKTADEQQGKGHEKAAGVTALQGGRPEEDTTSVSVPFLAKGPRVLGNNAVSTATSVVGKQDVQSQSSGKLEKQKGDVVRDLDLALAAVPDKDKRMNQSLGEKSMAVIVKGVLRLVVFVSCL